MKILIIPDIHGNWAETLEYIKAHKDEVDKVITLGDYVDDFDEKLNGSNMISGFRKLCDIARKEPDNFCICIGNHDLSYISDPNVSGHHYSYSADYKKMFMDNIDIMNICYNFDGYVFSHAGVSNRWVEIIKYNDKFNSAFEILDDVAAINYLFHNGCFGAFDYDERARDWGDGDSIEQGPLWIRPRSLSRDMFFDKQIVGHTEVRLNDDGTTKKVLIKKNGNMLFLTDSPTHNGYIIFDTKDNDYNGWEIVNG